jgi:hypothetical protein
VGPDSTFLGMVPTPLKPDTVRTDMNARRRLKIAARIDTLLTHELGQGIDPTRLLADPLYARDVLLACDAMRGTEAPQLARELRAALLAEAEAAAKTAGGRESSGFGPSRLLNSVFGPSSQNPGPDSAQDSANSGHGQGQPHTRARAKPARGWFARFRQPPQP